MNQIKRLAAFKNPDFYKAQKMRMSVYGKPRVISLAQSDDKYIVIPRGCYESLQEIAQQNNCTLNVTDKRNPGHSINVTFNGVLRPEQDEAAQAMLNHETGVLAATTAFGKTVTAAAIIAERKINTLILVHTQALLEQWKKALAEFLIIDEALPDSNVKRGRKKTPSIIGQLGGNKNELHGIIDIAVIQSLYHDNEVKDCVKNYGMVIVDECHHVSAVSFETVLREVSAKYVYGLTATPKRSDGHQPIIFMQCGNIRYTAKAEDYAKKHGFSHILVPRFTKYRPPSENMTITEHYQSLSESEYRNALIAEDVINAVKSGRNPIIISERMSHLEILYDMLSDAADHVIILSGKGTSKEKREILDRIRSITSGESLILLATGKYVGEGFDEPRLDTLFLALPISWSGTLSQYAGRLHREYPGKTSVMIYDYADIHVPMIENMYKRRLRGYASLGYTLHSEDDNIDYRTVYTENYESDLIRDIFSAGKNILISASYIKAAKLNLILKLANEAKLKDVQFKIVLKNSKSDYTMKIVNLLD